MLRILIFNTLYYPYKIGGAEISVKNLAEQLAKDASVRVGVITIGEKDDCFILNNVEVWRVKIENSYWSFDGKTKTTYQKLLWHIKDVDNNKYTDKIIKVIKKFQPNIINTNNLSGISVNVWNIARKLDIKVVHTLRDYYLQCPKTTKFKNNISCSSQCVDCKILSLMKKSTSQKVDAVIGISNFILEDHIEKGYFLHSKKQVVYNGFDFKTTKKERTIYKNNSFVVFGFIGQINKSKGIELLIESLNRLKKFPNWKLLIAGNIELNYKIKLQNRLDNGRVEFLGYTNTNEFFNLIDVLVVPSIWQEPFGRVVLEGIINKKIVLGSKKGGIPELLTNNTSFQFNPELMDMTRLLNQILKSPEVLNEFNFDQEILKQFSLDYSIERYIEVFNDILKPVL